jgi:hypothetical protein
MKVLPLEKMLNNQSNLASKVTPADFRSLKSGSTVNC